MQAPPQAAEKLADLRPRPAASLHQVVSISLCGTAALHVPAHAEEPALPAKITWILRRETRSCSFAYRAQLI